MKMKKQKRSLRKSPKSARRSRRKSDGELLKELEYYQLLKLLIAQGVEQIPGSPMFIEGWWPGKEKQKKSPKRNRRRH